MHTLKGLARKRPHLRLRTSHVGVSRLQSKYVYCVEEVENAIEAFGRDFNELRFGESVLIFCKEGKHRSAYLTAALLLGVTGEKPSAVCAYLKEVRNCVDFERAKDEKHFAGKTALANQERIWRRWGRSLRVSCDLPHAVTPTSFIREFDDRQRFLVWVFAT